MLGVHHCNGLPLPFSCLFLFLTTAVISNMPPANKTADVIDDNMSEKSVTQKEEMKLGNTSEYPEYQNMSENEVEELIHKEVPEGSENETKLGEDPEEVTEEGSRNEGNIGERSKHLPELSGEHEKKGDNIEKDFREMPNEQTSDYEILGESIGMKKDELLPSEEPTDEPVGINEEMEDKLPTEEPMDEPVGINGETKDELPIEEPMDKPVGINKEMEDEGNEEGFLKEELKGNMTEESLTNEEDKENITKEIEDFEGEVGDIVQDGSNIAKEVDGKGITDVYDVEDLGNKTVGIQDDMNENKEEDKREDKVSKPTGGSNGTGSIKVVKLTGGRNSTGSVQVDEFTGGSNSTGSIEVGELKSGSNSTDSIKVDELTGGSNGTGGIEVDELTGGSNGRAGIEVEELTGGSNSTTGSTVDDLSGGSNGTGGINELTGGSNGTGGIEVDELTGGSNGRAGIEVDELTGGSNSTTGSTVDDLSGGSNGTTGIMAEKSKGRSNATGSIKVDELTGGSNGTGGIKVDKLTGGSNGTGSIKVDEFTDGSNGTGGIEVDELTGGSNGTGGIEVDVLQGGSNGTAGIEVDELTGESNGTGGIEVGELTGGSNGTGSIKVDELTGRNNGTAGIVVDELTGESNDTSSNKVDELTSGRNGTAGIEVDELQGGSNSTDSIEVDDLKGGSNGTDDLIGGLSDKSGHRIVTDNLIGELPDEPDEEPKKREKAEEEDWRGKTFTWTESPIPTDYNLEKVVEDLSKKISWFKYVGNATLRCADVAKEQDTLMMAIEELHNCLETNYQKCASEYARETGCVAPAYHEEACGHFRMGFRDQRMYLSTQDCWWVLILPTEFMINVTIDEFYMENSGPECYYDYMIAFNGDNTNSPSFGRFCGRRLKFTLYGTTNTMLVHAKTDNSVGKVGFRAVYQVMDPNLGLTLRNATTLTEPYGDIVISDLPPTLLDSYVKSWYYTIVYIRADYGSKISIAFEFTIDGEDYLTFHDGPLETNKAIVNLTATGKAKRTRRLWTTSFLASVILRKTDPMTSTQVTANYATHVIEDLSESHSTQCKGNSSMYLSPEGGGHWISLKATAKPLKKRPISCYWTFTTDPGYSVMIRVNEFQPNGPTNDECFYEGLLVVNDNEFKDGAQRLGPFCDSEPPGLFGGRYSVFNQYVSPGSSVIVMLYSFMTYPSSTAKERGPFRAFVTPTRCRGIVQLCSSPLPRIEEKVYRLVPRGQGDTVHINFYCDKAACCVLQQFPIYKPLAYKKCNVTIQTEGSKLIATSVFALYTAISNKEDTSLLYACEVHSTQALVTKGAIDQGYQCLGSKMFITFGSLSPWVTASFSLTVSERRCGYFQPMLHDTYEFYPPCALADFPPTPATYKLHYIDPFYKGDRYFSFVFNLLGNNCPQQCLQDRIEFHDRHAEFIWERLPRLPFRWHSWSSSGGNWSRGFVLVRNPPLCYGNPNTFWSDCQLQVHFKENHVVPASEDIIDLQCPAGFTLAGRSCYKVAETRGHVSGVPFTDTDTTSYTEGRHLCREAGGELVSINSKREMATVHRFLFEKAWKKYLQYSPGIKVIFIGLQASAKYKELRWVTGQPLTYMEWNNPVFNQKRPTHFRYTHPKAKVQPSISSEVIREELKHLQPSVTKGYNCIAMVIDNPFEKTRWVKIPCDVKIPGALSLCEASPVNMTLPYTEGQFGENTSRTYDFMSVADTISTGYTTRIVPVNNLHLLVMAENMCPSPFVNLGTKCIALTTNIHKIYVKTGFSQYECKRGEYNRLLQDYINDISSLRLGLGAATFNKQETKLLKLMLPSLMHTVDSGKIRLSYEPSKTTLDKRDCYVLAPSWNAKEKRQTWKIHPLEHYDDEYRKCDGKAPFEGHHKDLYNYICEVNSITFSSVCEKHHYKCGDGTCILIHNMCDGKADCLDGTDETTCDTVCNSTTTGEPLQLEVCFSDHLCKPDSCVCTDKYFQCTSGGCVPVSKVCNFYSDCRDGSDEMACSAGQCTEKEYTCKSGQCVHQDKYCDFVQDCVDGSDEADCGFNTSCPSSLQGGVGGVDKYKGRFYSCPDHTCVPKSSVGDFVPDCPAPESMDESEFLDSFSNYPVSSDGEPQLQPSTAICHLYRASCSLHIKRCFYRNESCVFDLDSRHQLKGCRDAAHLQNCEARQCGHMFKCPNSYCLPIRRVCDGFYDCENGEDEVNCDTYYCPGMFRCKNERQCISQHEVCDGVVNCHLSGEDEELCELRSKDCPAHCLCYGHYVNCSHVEPDETVMDKILKNLDENTRALILRYNSFTQIPKDIVKFYKLHRLDVSHNGINALEEVFDNLEALVELHLAYNRITTFSKPYFKKLKNLRVLNLEHNAISHTLEDCFVGLESLPILDLSFQQFRQIQSFQFNGLTNLKKLILSDNYIDSIQAHAFSRRGDTDDVGLVFTTLELLVLTGNPISVSEQSAFEMLPTQVNLTTDRHKFCCFASHVVSCYPQADEFSSCSQMIASKVLRVVVWGIGLLAFIGNLIVLQQRMKHEKETPPSLLVHHLSFSDLLMGAYLLIIAGADQYFKDQYIDYTDKWRVHVLCKLSGFLSMLSCEMSAFLTLLITLDRLLACVPLCGGQSLLLRSTRGLIAMGWTMSAVVSVIPILEFPYFGSQGYVRSGVCMTFNIIKGKVSGWEYSMAVFVIFNSICYLASGLGYTLVSVAVAQGVEIWEKYLPEELEEEERESELIFRNNDHVIAKRLVLVVMTNFLVWVALITVSMLTLLDYTLHATVSAWLTLIVLPLNAAINPFLYAFSTRPYRILDDDLLANWLGEAGLAEGEEDKAETEMADSTLASSQSFRKNQDVSEMDEESKARETAKAREAVIKELL